MTPARAGTTAAIAEFERDLMDDPRAGGDDPMSLQGVDVASG